MSAPYITDPSTECWVWQRARSGKGAAAGGGYGCLRVNGRLQLAHRVAYEKHHGPIPKGQHVRHLCNNSLCVNPSHLAAGTNHENVADRVRAGGYRSRLTPAQVAEIRWRVARGQSQRKVAGDYGLHQADVSNIVNRKYWKHV